MWGDKNISLQSAGKVVSQLKKPHLLTTQSAGPIAEIREQRPYVHLLLQDPETSPTKTIASADIKKNG